MSYKDKSYSEYQRIYRENNKQKAKEYQKEYRLNKFVEKRKNNDHIQNIKKLKSRIYICRLSDDRLKIGATFADSDRISNLTRLVNELGFTFTPIYYYDCECDYLIKKVERKLKSLFCKTQYGLNINSFKNEVTHINSLNEIKNCIELMFENSGLSYEIRILK